MYLVNFWPKTSSHWNLIQTTRQEPCGCPASHRTWFWLVRSRCTWVGLPCLAFNYFHIFLPNFEPIRAHTYTNCLLYALHENITLCTCNPPHPHPYTYDTLVYITMDTDCNSSATPRVEVGPLLLCSTRYATKELRAAVYKRVVVDGRGFKAANGGGCQKFLLRWRRRFFPIWILVLHAEIIWVVNSYLKIRPVLRLFCTYANDVATRQGWVLSQNQ